MARISDGRAFRILNIMDECTRECLVMLVRWRITSQDVIDQLYELFLFRGVTEHIRSGNGPDLTALCIFKTIVVNVTTASKEVADDTSRAKEQSKVLG